MAVRVVNPDLDTDPDIADIAALEPTDGDLLRWDSDGTRYSGIQPSALTVTSTGGTTKTLAEWMQDVAESDAAFLTPEDYGAVGDVVSYASGGAVASGSTTFTGTGFTSSHEGKRIIIQGAGAAGVPHEATIAAYVSATQVTLSVAASTTVTSAEYAYGTDDSAAFVLMEAARVAMQPGAVCVLRPVIYGLSNVAIQTRSQSNEINDGWICVGGKATLKAIRTVDDDYLVATDRWIDGATWPGFSGTPFTFANIRFDGSNIVDWPEVCKGYEWKHYDCEWANGRVGQAKQTRQNQYNEVIRVTADVTSGSSTLTNVTFVSSTGAAVSLSGIKLRQLIDGTGFVASTSNSPYITAINTGAGTLTISQNASATATGATFYINRNGAGNRYQSECYWMDGQFKSGDGCTYLFKNEGTVESDRDASTDGWFMNNVVNGEDVATYGMWFGNTGGWHIKGQHSYSSDYDMWVAALGYNHIIDGNEFEDWVYIRNVFGKNELGPGNTFWEGLEIAFTDDTSTEELTIAAPRFTQLRGGGSYAQIKINTARANKSVYVAIPHFRAGETANSTNPVNIVNLGTVTLDGGVDGDGFIGRRVYRNDATGVTQVTLHDSASPAASDVIWSLTNKGRNSAAAIKDYASEEVQISDATSTSEDAKRVFRQMINGTLTQVVSFEPYILQQIAGGAGVGLFATGEGDTALDLKRYSSVAAEPTSIRGYKARGTISSPASVNQFDETFRITAGGYSSSAFRDVGYIRHYVFAATPSSTDMEGQWRIEACAAGSASVTEIARFSHANGFAMFGANTVVDAARGIRSVSYTSTQLNDITNAVNTANKAAGKMVWNSTASKPVWAVGSTAGSVWVDGAGSTVNTPV